MIGLLHVIVTEVREARGPVASDQALPLAGEVSTGARTVRDKAMSFDRLVAALHRLTSGGCAMTQEERTALLEAVDRHDAVGRALQKPFTALKGDLDIFFRRSRCRKDLGRAQSDHDDPKSAGANQFQSGIAIAPSGRLDVAWYDGRLSPIPPDTSARARETGFPIPDPRRR